MPWKFKLFLHWAVLPAFVVLTAISILICTAFLVSAAANADFCGGQDSTPDKALLGMLVHSNVFAPDQFQYKAAEYYAFQCTNRTTEDALLPLREYENDIVCYLSQLQYARTTMPI